MGLRCKNCGGRLGPINPVATELFWMVMHGRLWRLVVLTLALTVSGFGQCTPPARHCMILTWTPSVTPGVVGYDVYRSTSAGQEIFLNSTPASSTYEDDAVTSGQTYYYVLTAVASDGVTQSPQSNEASGTIPNDLTPDVLLLSLKRDEQFRCSALRDGHRSSGFPRNHFGTHPREMNSET